MAINACNFANGKNIDRIHMTVYSVNESTGALTAVSGEAWELKGLTTEVKVNFGTQTENLQTINNPSSNMKPYQEDYEITLTGLITRTSGTNVLRKLVHESRQDGADTRIVYMIVEFGTDTEEGYFYLTNYTETGTRPKIEFEATLTHACVFDTSLTTESASGNYIRVGDVSTLG